MKKFTWIAVLALIVSIPTFAGGYLTNTNQNVAFLRMIARGASTEIDAVYSNPAGLAFIGKDGFYISLNSQSAFQTRQITADFLTYTNIDGKTGTAPFQKHFKGTASAPVIPSVQAAYKMGNWVFSGSFAINGGGGKASFDQGLPMFYAMTMSEIYRQTGKLITPNMYNVNSAMDGKQYIFGVQLGATYKFNDWLSGFAGGRMNYVSAGYKGYVTAILTDDYAALAPLLPSKTTTIVDRNLDVDQTGWGITPIIGLDAKVGKWNFGAKYEFKTKLNIENKTKSNTTEIEAYDHGVNTPNDIPAYLSVAANYQFLPTLNASVEYHHFFDKQAGMASDKQKTLKSGTNEYLAGVEWDIIKYVTVSGGFQYTDYGLSDDFQTDTSFYCDSYSLGFGAKFNVTEKLSFNVAYFWTKYKNYTEYSANYNNTSLPDMPALSGTNVYKRTNKVFGIGIDYKF